MSNLWRINTVTALTRVNCSSRGSRLQFSTEYLINCIMIQRTEFQLTSSGHRGWSGAGEASGGPGVTLAPELREELLHLLPVDHEAQDPHHPPLLVHQVLLHVVPGLGLRLTIAGEVGLVAVYHRAVQDCWSVLYNKTVHRMLSEDWQCNTLGFLLIGHLCVEDVIWLNFPIWRNMYRVSQTVGHHNLPFAPSNCPDWNLEWQNVSRKPENIRSLNSSMLDHFLLSGQVRAGPEPVSLTRDMVRLGLRTSLNWISPRIQTPHPPAPSLLRSGLQPSHSVLWRPLTQSGQSGTICITRSYWCQYYSWNVVLHYQKHITILCTTLHSSSWHFQHFTFSRDYILI